MCWRDPDEPYNGGNAFKICCRDHRGVMVTIIADNYYGYCKKEVKTQISYSANLLRLVRRRARGRRDGLGDLRPGTGVLRRPNGQPEEDRFEEGDAHSGRHGGSSGPRRYAVDRRYPDIYYRAGEFGLSACAKATCNGSMAGKSHDLTLRADAALRASVRIPHPSGKARGGIDLAAGGHAAARHAVPQAVHGFGRRQIGDL